MAGRYSLAMTGSDRSGPLIGAAQREPISAAQRQGLQLVLQNLALAESLIDRVLVESPMNPVSADHNERLREVKAGIAAAAGLIRERLG